MYPTMSMVSNTHFPAGTAACKRLIASKYSNSPFESSPPYYNSPPFLFFKTRQLINLLDGPSLSVLLSPPLSSFPLYSVSHAVSAAVPNAPAAASGAVLAAAPLLALVAEITTHPLQHLRQYTNSHNLTARPIPAQHRRPTPPNRNSRVST